MTEIEPTYYAEGTYKHDYKLTGRGFMGLPSDCVAVPSDDNNDPLKLRDTVTEHALMTMVERTETSARFQASVERFHYASYLGAILSADRQTVYWVNNTRPLP